MATAPCTGAPLIIFFAVDRSTQFLTLKIFSLFRSGPRPSPTKIQRRFSYPVKGILRLNGAVYAGLRVCSATKQ